MKTIITSIAFCFSIVVMHGQQTIGLFENDISAFNGYTLFAPLAYDKTYLIDNCGEVVNTWESNFKPGQLGYLTEDGDLIRACRISSDFTSGGAGGRIERHNWEGDLTWSYNYTFAGQYHQHHDIEILPNGNILVLAWEIKTVSEAIQAGRVVGDISPLGIWSERIAEIKPVGESYIEVVWEWHAWDHLVQDNDSLVDNYENVSDHPELININYNSKQFSLDWLHANSIDYNPELDQIIINTRNNEEFWIIDHSTTSAEAAGHVGGDRQKGGDLLYRWGNPETYDRGFDEDKQLYLQHDAHWIPKGLPGEGNIMIFNNGVERPEGQHSSIDIISPPIDSLGNYVIEDFHAFGPDTAFWRYDGGSSNRFFSPRISGAQRLSNGNTLICNGISGDFFEIDQQDSVVWKYISPVSGAGPVSQGSLPGNRDVFRAYRYPVDYPGLVGRDLTPQGPIELNPLPSECVIHEDSTSSTRFGIAEISDLEVFPNPIFNTFTIQSETNNNLLYEVISSTGILIQTARQVQSGMPCSADSWSSGMYIIHIFTRDLKRQSFYKVIKI